MDITAPQKSVERRKKGLGEKRGAEKKRRLELRLRAISQWWRRPHPRAAGRSERAAGDAAPASNSSSRRLHQKTKTRKTPTTGRRRGRSGACKSSASASSRGTPFSPELTSCNWPFATAARSLLAARAASQRLERAARRKSACDSCSGSCPRTRLRRDTFP